MNFVSKLKGLVADGAGAPEPEALPSPLLVSSAIVKAKVGVGGRR